MTRAAAHKDRPSMRPSFWKAEGYARPVRVSIVIRAAQSARPVVLIGVWRVAALLRSLGRGLAQLIQLEALGVLEAGESAPREWPRRFSWADRSESRR